LGFLQEPALSRAAGQDVRKNLVHAIIGGKDLDCALAELSVNLVLTRAHNPFSTYDTSTIS
jgi:hypothetical protein